MFTISLSLSSHHSDNSNHKLDVHWNKTHVFWEFISQRPETETGRWILPAEEVKAKCPKNNLETKGNVKIWCFSPSSDLLCRFSFGLLKISRIILADFRAVIKSVEIWLKREIEWLDWRQEKRGEIDRNFQRFTLRHFYIPQGRGDQKQHRQNETFNVQLTNITRQSTGSRLLVQCTFVCGRRDSQDWITKCTWWQNCHSLGSYWIGF